MSMPRLVIFDWDGTLMDSERQIVHCMRLAAAELDVVVPAHEAVRRIIGLGLPEAIEALFPGLPGELREAIRQAYARHFVAGAGGESGLFPHARELLDGLRTRGHLLAVATGKSRLGLDRVLLQAGLQRFFDASRCADETASKPDSRMLLELLAQLEVPPDEALMVGDTTFDLEMAARAGVRSIGVSHGAHDEDALAAHAPIVIVPDLVTLAPCLASL